MIRVGLVGASDPRHRLFLAAVHRRRAGVRIVGVSDPDPARRTEFGRQYELPAFADHRDLLAGVGPALIALAASDAGPAVIDALEAGADVLVAPPICTRADDLELITRLTGSTGRRVTAAYTYRGHPTARTARELILDGKLGRPDLATMIIGPDTDRSAIGEAIDLFGWLTDARPGEPQLITHDPEDTRAFGKLILNITGNGAAGPAELEVRRRDDLPSASVIIQVAGSDGAVEWDTASGLLRSVINGRDPVTVSCGPFSQPDEWVLNNLLRKPRPAITTEQSLATTRTLLAAERLLD